MLLAAGAKANVRDSTGNTPLSWAAAFGNAEAVKLFLAASAEVNTKNKDGVTPLHGAAWSGHTDVVKLLLAATADINARDNAGRTALDFCRTNERVPPEKKKSVEELLLEHGATTGTELDAETPKPAEEHAQPEPGR